MAKKFLKLQCWNLLFILPIPDHIYLSLCLISNFTENVYMLSKIVVHAVTALFEDLFLVLELHRVLKLMQRFKVSHKSL